MSRDELWRRYCASNPKFAKDDEMVTLTARGLRKLFEQTYDLAHKAGADAVARSAPDRAFPDILRAMGLSK